MRAFITLKKLQNIVVGTILAQKCVKYFWLDEIDHLLFILAEARGSDKKGTLKYLFFQDPVDA
ncbi:hypothetical protein TSAR_004061 [Trichomalopsis sarcophagae]|uniref:Uncharacterized protein n=1 Tax=Trichomalopsis sarcophagae TaxID=543379 RepID=A0A232F0P0_9HYME|nr:hypothetical protein TSAR_004061 [Trichomalopsis sarcophagae]